MNGKVRITPGTLRPGQKKVVTYTGKDCTVTVPDPSWDGVGDLSHLPDKLKDKLAHYSKNGFTKEQTVIDDNTRTPRHPCGKKVLDDFDKQGYSIDGRKVSWQELDSRGNRLS